MDAHIIVAHPEAHSLNASLGKASAAFIEAQGGQATLSNLYAQNFDPAEGAQHYDQRSDAAFFHTQTEQRFNANNQTLPPQVQYEMDRLLGCDLLIVHFPLWWFGPPAMLKGWMDRVFVYGQMYTSQRRYDHGVCKGKKMLACVTTGASAESCAYNGREGDTQLHLWPALFPFHYIGFDVLTPATYHGVGGVASIEEGDGPDNQITRILNDWTGQLDGIATRPKMPFNSVDDFDEDKRLKPDAPSHSPFVRHNP